MLYRKRLFRRIVSSNPCVNHFCLQPTYPLDVSISIDDIVCEGYFYVSDIDPIKLASYWHSAVLPDFGHPPARREVKPSRPHLTAMFAANGKEPGANEYAEKRSVVEALLGAVQPVNVVGLFVTKRTVGLRITLEGSQQLDLWNSDDDAAVGPDSPSGKRFGLSSYLI